MIIIDIDIYNAKTMVNAKLQFLVIEVHQYDQFTLNE